MSIDLNELASAIGQLVLRFRVRRRNAADWITSNEILLSSEFGYETDTRKMKIGDGVSGWNNLEYWPSGISSGGGGGTDLSSKNAGVGIDISLFQPTAGGGGGNYADDPHFDDVVFLSHFDGATGDHVSTDNGPLGLAVSQRLNSGGNFGGHLDTAAAKFGPSSAVGRWQAAFNSAMNVGADDWTIEGWCYPTSTTFYRNCLVSLGNPGAFNGSTTPNYPPQGLFVTLNTGGLVQVTIVDSDGTSHTKQFIWDARAGSVNPFANNVWTCFRIQRHGTVITVYGGDRQLYIDEFTEPGAASGVAGRYEWDIGTIAIQDGSTPFVIGGIGSDTMNDNQTWTFNGYIDEVRFTAGVARYASVGTGVLTVAAVGNIAAPTTTFPGYNAPLASAGEPYIVIKNTGVVNLVAGTGISLTTQPVPGTGDDPQWANVSMLLHMDGDDGQLRAYDSSSNGLTIANNGDVALSSSIKKFGRSGGVIGQAGGYWSTPDNDLFDMGAGDWTIESWFLPQPFTVGGTSHQAIFSIGKFGNSGTSGTAALGITWTNAFVDVYLLDMAGTAYHFKFYDYVVPNDGSYNPSAPTYTAQNPNPALDNQWNHIAIQRVGTKVYVWLNGWQAGYNSEQTSGVGAAGYPTARGGYDIGGVTLNNLASPFNVGKAGSLAYQFYGGVDDVRVTKGVSRYSGLTFDLPTAAFWSTDTPVELETVISTTAEGEGGGSGGGTGYQNPIDAPPAVPNAWDDEFDGTTLHSDWSLVNATNGGATCTASVSGGSLWMHDDVAVSGQARLLVKSAPAGDFTIISKMRMHGGYSFHNLGIGLYNSAGPASYLVRAVNRTDGSTFMQGGFISFVNPNGLSSPSETNVGTLPDELYMKIVRVGSTTSFFVSSHGRYWIIVGSFTTPVFDKISIFYSNFSTSQAACVVECEWIRRTT